MKEQRMRERENEDIRHRKDISQENFSFASSLLEERKQSQRGINSFTTIGYQRKREGDRKLQ
jgi:hypothetical protein